MTDLLETYQEAFATPFNVFLLALTLGMFLFWLSAHKWQTPERVRRRAIFLNPKPTQFLQQKLRSIHPTLTIFLDFITIQVWLWVFAVTVIIEIYICGLQGDEAWRYGVMVLLAWGTSMTIQFLFPVIVPNRWDQFDRTLPVTPIRLLKFPQSDNVNGLLYNGLPSNHFGMMLAGAMLSLFFYFDDQYFGPGFWGWMFAIFFFLSLALFFCFSVLYLGEHYWQDLIASIFVYIPIMMGIKLILDILVPIS